MLKPLAIILGLTGIVTRGLGVLFPDTFRNIMVKLASSNAVVRGVGVLALILAFLVLFAVGKQWAGARIVMGVLGILFLLGGLVMVLLPPTYISILNWFISLSDPALRTFAASGVVFGVVLVILAIVYY